MALPPTDPAPLDPLTDRIGEWCRLVYIVQNDVVEVLDVGRVR